MKIRYAILILAVINAVLYHLPLQGKLPHATKPFITICLLTFLLAKIQSQKKIEFLKHLLTGFTVHYLSILVWIPLCVLFSYRFPDTFSEYLHNMASETPRVITDIIFKCFYAPFVILASLASYYYKPR